MSSDFFTILIIILAFGLLYVRNPVVAVILLVVIYITVAMLFISLGAEFVAVIIVVVYAGAISILFLFVVMMLNLRSLELSDTLVYYISVGCIIVLMWTIELLFLVYFNFLDVYLYVHRFNMFFTGILSHGSNLHFLGQLLLNYSYYLVIPSACILLLSMIASIMLTIDNNDSLSVFNINNISFYNYRAFNQHNESQNNNNL